MTTFLRNLCTVTCMAVLLGACSETEDPGPLIPDTRNFNVDTFDGITMGSGFTIYVEQGDEFRVRADGDKRNLDDLRIEVKNNTLFAEYDDHANRRHTTTFTITMPSLRAINFSGGTLASITGFESNGILTVNLSGGSVATANAGYRKADITLSGASVLTLRGLGDELEADVSGASKLDAYEFPVGLAKIRASGASGGRLMISNQLVADASGASVVYYRGNPSVQSTVSGASKVVRD